MKMIVRTVAHWAKKSWTRCEIEGPPATGTSTAWCNCCESCVSASLIFVSEVCTAPWITEVSADLDRTSPLYPQDLVQSRATDLQLGRRGLARAEHALKLMTRYPQGFCGPGGGVTLAPCKDFDR